MSGKNECAYAFLRTVQYEEDRYSIERQASILYLSIGKLSRSGVIVPRKDLLVKTCDYRRMVRSSGKQDDWRADTSGVKYYQIFGKQIGQSVIDKPTIGIIRANANSTFVLDPTDGDGTVPLISASRIGNGKNYNPSGMNCSAALASTDTINDHCHMIQKDLIGLHSAITTVSDTFTYVLLYLKDSSP